MSRLDRSRLDAAALPVTIEVATRFDDLDMQGHVNNAAAVVLLQEARANFNTVAGLPGLREGLRVMVASLTVEYVGEMHHPAPVAIATGVLALGRTSVTLGQVARQEGRIVLYAQATLVLAGEDGPAPIPEPLRAAYQRLAIS